jgi:galactokinase
VRAEEKRPNSSAARDAARQLARSFEERFGRPAELAVRAPGRVNLIGEHTDYNDGLVLPCAIDRETFVLAARRDDRRVRVWSKDEGEEVIFALDRVREERPTSRVHWSDYVRGVVFALGDAGGAVPGLDLAVASRVPIGAGLSSSAAFTVALATSFDRARGGTLSPSERAAVAHRAESDYLGIGSGILDQFASALGERDHALLIDCRSRHVQKVALPSGRTQVLVADSGVRRSLAAADSGYRQRVAECRAALEAARASGIVSPDATALRDLELDDIPKLEAILDPVLLRRARHVVRENERVLACVAALSSGDLAAAGEEIREGHASLRDDFEVSTPELDALCAIADAHPGVYGSRLTGAGFGGCTLHLIHPEAADDVAVAISDGFEKRFGRRPPILRVATADRAGDLALG